MSTPENEPDLSPEAEEAARLDQWKRARMRLLAMVGKYPLTDNEVLAIGVAVGYVHTLQNDIEATKKYIELLTAKPESK